MAFQALRDHVMYNYGYYQGRVFSFSGPLSNAYASMLSHMSSLVALPVPLLSFLAVPFFGNFSTTVSLFFFSLTWATLVSTHNHLHVEIFGTLAIRFLFFLLPSLAALAFDSLLPSLSASIKARGEAHLPAKIGPRRLRNIAAISILNTGLAVALQAALEFLLTEIMGVRSPLRVHKLPPSPQTMVKHVIYGIIFRGFLHYFVHHDLLHAPPRHSFLARWHADWAHSLRYPFSLAAAYDHPVCHLLAHWLPIYLPALFFRFHVLTWFVFLALVSLEQFFIYSGYAILPSQILLAGMARRTDAHYASGGKGNFGHWGVLDWIFGTICPGDADIVDDARDEFDKRDVGHRVSDAVQNRDEEGPAPTRRRRSKR